MAAIDFKIAADFLHSRVMKDSSVAKVYATIHRAIADLEIRVPDGGDGMYAAGQVYDFFNDLNRVIASAEKSIFIIDPYLEQSVFDHYLTSRQAPVAVRLLLNHNAEKIVPAVSKYVHQHGNVLEVRKSSKLHDRVIFVDGYVCWLVGQSLKDAAKAKPTYLVQVSPDVVSEKLASYETIWADADVL